MSVEIVTETAQFLEKEYINGIFDAVENIALFTEDQAFSLLCYLTPPPPPTQSLPQK
jgi:hypothetical protein